MNRSRLLFLLISGILVLTILSGTLLGAPTREDEGDDSLYKYLSVFTEVLRLVRQAYVDETDLDLLMNGALDGTPDALDPFSMYVPEEAVSDFMAAQKLGVTRSGLRVAKERGVAYVIAVQEKAPADTLGLEQGDILSRLDGDSTREIPLWRIEKALTQAPGTEVKLQVLRAGETRDFTLVLAEFEPPIAYVETYQRRAAPADRVVLQGHGDRGGQAAGVDRRRRAPDRRARRRVRRRRARLRRGQALRRRRPRVPDEA